MSTEQLIADARARLTTRRIGSSIMRETDKDLIVIRRLVEALEQSHLPTDQRAYQDAVARQCGCDSCREWLATSERLRRVATDISAEDPQGEPSDAPELPDDCDCEDREALVRPEGLVCGTCDKVIAPGGVL